MWVPQQHQEQILIHVPFAIKTSRSFIYAGTDTKEGKGRLIDVMSIVRESTMN